MKISANRRRRFIQLVKKHRNSNMSITDFCLKNKIHKWTFWYWRKKVLNEKSVITKLSTENSQKLPSFLPVTVRQTPFESIEEKIEVHYPSGVRISLPSSYDLSKVRSLITEVGTVS